MNSAKQCMNSAKQCVNSEPMWGYCLRAEKKKKKAENVDAAKRGMQTVTTSDIQIFGVGMQFSNFIHTRGGVISWPTPWQREQF